MRKIDVNEIIKENYDHSIFENIEYSYDNLSSHIEVAGNLESKHPYTITILIENLNQNLWRRKEYVKQNKLLIQTKYTELLYRYFFEEYGEEKGNTLYSQFLEKYRSRWIKAKQQYDIDDYIVNHELEPRYKKIILQRFKDIEKLQKPRYRIERERYYRLPSPFDHIDWRNPYDNIFIWREGKKSFARRGGGGSSGQREFNSKFIYGYALINKKHPVPSYIFIYNSQNLLRFIKKFRSLTVPRYDIGSNYFLPHETEIRILNKVRFLEWNILDNINEIRTLEATDSY
ncbi:hypothetical protein HZB96_05010 [Candidatus Gottesmanbacteria bacterium]|nr:hypothetical protein [Candidatus Gottesmanbacteria bacterium]MBI5452028.1 hypothetical protein [Candidatus Gottesmanbacteria bacterium]